jgi:hypothetical protein
MIRRVLEAVDATAVEAAVGSWLAARLQAARQPPSRAGPRERRAVAVDGKAVRGTRHASGDGHARHLLAAVDQRSGAVLTQAEVDGKANEITRFAPLLEPLDLAGTVTGRSSRGSPASPHHRGTRSPAWPRSAVAIRASTRLPPAAISSSARQQVGTEATWPNKPP